MMRTGGKVLTLLLGIMTTIALTGTPVHAATTSTDFQPQIAYYLVISQLSGKCLDLNGGSQDDGAAIIQWSCHGAVNQQWRATLKGKGFFEISVAQSGKCLAVSGASLDNGADVVQQPCGGYQGNRLWYVLPESGSYGIVRNLNSNKCLDVRDVSQSDGAAIQQWDCHGGGNQQWLFKQ